MSESRRFEKYGFVPKKGYALTNDLIAITESIKSLFERSDIGGDIVECAYCQVFYRQYSNCDEVVLLPEKRLRANRKTQHISPGKTGIIRGYGCLCSNSQDSRFEQKLRDERYKRCYPD